MSIIKLVACDMDGTLLNSSKHISEGNIAAVKKLEKAGVQFVIATGRHDSMIRHYIDELEIDMPVISCNGAIVRNPVSKQRYGARPLTKEQTESIIEISREYGTDFHIYADNTIYGKSATNKILLYQKLNAGLPEDRRVKMFVDPDYTNFIRNTEEDLFKVLVIPEDLSMMDEIKQKIEAECGVQVTRSDYNLLDIMQSGITKEEGLKTLCGALGIGIEEAAVIGDEFNDLEMFRGAGTSIAVANAIDLIKEAASFVTEADNNHDGVAEAISIILKQ